MATIDELEVNQCVKVTLGAKTKTVGNVVGRRIDNRIEGYLPPQQNGSPQPERGDNVVQVHFPFSPLPALMWQTTGLMCPPSVVDILEE
ncbi:hypothetical protein ACOSOMT5_P2465 [Acidiphilium sp. MT5]